MKTIGSHPGAINFRLTLMVMLILLFILVFLHYVGKAEQSIERQSLLQTQRVINSALAVVFATYASEGRLGELAALEGANPFELVRRYQLIPSSYQGETESFDLARMASGWHYLKPVGDVIYLPFHGADPSFFRLSLSFEDRDGDGRFEPRQDRFLALRLMQKKQPR